MSSECLTDAAAFEALARHMGGDPAPFAAAEPSIERLRAALRDRTATPQDLAVLTRHALRAEAARRGPGSRPRLPDLPDRGLTDGLLARSSLVRTADGEIEASFWAPEWAPDWSGADDSAAAAARLRFGPQDEGPPADPFLARVGRTRYRSAGQRSALRAAMLAPPGGALAVDLPTGEGKSLIFMVLDRVGFASDPVPPGGRRPGVVLVVVPTVALAYDHENACRRDEDEILAYVGGGGTEGAARRGAVRQRVEANQDGLCFAAPEAACTGLRQALRTAAAAGRLKAVVVDEAHLVDAWGTGFRSDFQLLSGLVAELADLAPPGQEPRTVLLSATLAPETLETLGVLFPGRAGLQLVSAAQARPEPIYYVATACDPAERALRVEEALLHLPRPAILYVTKVSDARDWEVRLRALGFGRLRAFHGETPDADRQATLRAWRLGELDLVVATSAFGLGIDYPHVRTVVHACVPETFDRFYQEVGRAGRDGRAAASLVLPSSSDLHLARQMNRKRVLSVKRGLERWRSMFEHPTSRHLGGMRFRLRMDAAPGTGEDDIDLISERGVDWNARLLTVLARSGMVRLLGEACDDGSREEEETGVFETVEILDGAHLDASAWVARVEPVRKAIADASARNLALMEAHLEGGRCPFDLVEELYASLAGGNSMACSAMARTCSACPVCRADPAARRPSRPRREPVPPGAPPEPSSVLANLVAEGRLLVTYDAERAGAFQERRMRDLLRRLVEHGVRSIAILGSDPAPFARALEALANVPVFVERPRSLALRRIPRGGVEAVIVGPDADLDAAAVQPSLSHRRVLFVPEDIADPERSDALLLDRYTGLRLTPDGLNARLAR